MANSDYFQGYLAAIADVKTFIRMYKEPCVTTTDMFKFLKNAETVMEKPLRDALVKESYDYSERYL